jgi:hypothetical protein
MSLHSQIDEESPGITYWKKNIKIPMSKISRYSHLCTEERIHDEESPGITYWKKNLKIPISRYLHLCT